MNAINEHITQYYQWLKDRTFVQKDEQTDWYVINTPFFGAFNDSIDLYAKNNGNKILFSDNGETLNNLEIQGININQSKYRRQLFENILRSYGIKFSQEELIIETEITNFAQAKHNMICGILEINDLHILSKTNVSSIFKEDVRNHLDKLDLIYTPDFISKGQTGLEFNFDFQIAKRNEEIVIKSFNTINKIYLSNFLFSWEDIKPIREKATKKEVRAIAFINDFDKEVKQEFLDALLSKNADYILWSKRNNENNKLKLVA